ncbi:MAG: alpha/beta hydrolase [Pseudomonadota bacterium]
MFRRAALAIVLLTLAACGGGDGRAPFVESRIPPGLGPRFWPPEGWAWGLFKVGDAPAQRYGVSSTIGTPKGSVLILTDFGETTEVWFETARDLNAAGYTVWVLERAGQGGSERHALPRDLVHVPSFDGDVTTTRALARTIMQGSPDAPLTIVGQGVGGLVGLSAIQTGAPAYGLVLSNPKLAPRGVQPGWPAWLMNLGAGRLPAAVGQGWKREGADGVQLGLTADPWRGKVQKAWQVANPDLRMGGPSVGWNAAFAREAKAAAARTAPADFRVLLIASPDSPDFTTAEEACKPLKCLHAVLTTAPGGKRDLAKSSFPLEADPTRLWWLHNLACALPGGVKGTPWSPDAPCPDA